MPGPLKKCAVPTCVTDSRVLKQIGVTLRYYTFPKDTKLKEEWLCRCNKSYNELLKSDAICSRHFHIDDYVDAVVSKVLNVKPRKLKPEAIPSLFLERRPEKLLKGNSLEYHTILAQEILSEEKQAASKSSEFPIYLEFTNHKNSEHKWTSPRLSLNEELIDIKECAVGIKHMDFHGEARIGTQEVSCKLKAADVQEPILEPGVNYNECDENHPAEDVDCAGSKLNVNDFIGNCYVCDKKIKKHDTLISEDFTKIIQKAFGDISPDNEVVIKKDDGLCGTCCDLMKRIVRLEAELRTATLGMRALLRLKYSLPPSLMVNMTPVEHKKFSNFSRSPKVKDRMTQTNKSVFYNQKHKLTQTTPSLMKTVVTSINDVEILETGKLEVSDDKKSDEKNAGLLQTSTQILGNECLFEDISDISDLMILMNDNCLAEESVVVTEEKNITGSIEEKQLAVKKKPQLQLGLLKCSRCSFKTKSAESMKTHLLSFENKEGFYCSICDFAFHVQNRFKRHKVCHSEASKDKRCIFCKGKIHDKLHMRFHIEASHRKNSFAHRCSICNAVFMFDRQLRKHQKLKHKMGVSFKCEKCKRSFGDKIKYDNHIEFFHRDSLVCKYCLRDCTSMEKLIIHENSQHRFDRKEYYRCSYCPKRFLRQDLLPLHEEQHTGQFEYRCDLCDYGFHEAELLKKHQTRCKAPVSLFKKISPKNVNFPSQINCVNKLLPEQRFSNVEQVTPTHRSLVCDVCGKVITTQQKYKIHRELHDNPSPFQCHFCGKKFRYEGNMTIHIKNLHTANPE